jgi:hypothetical protein
MTPSPDTPTATASSGLGVPCAEAQADGVPCAEIGADCAICGRAAPCPHTPADASVGATVGHRVVADTAATARPGGPDA